MTNLQIVQNAYKGFSEGNMEPLFSNLAEDVVWKNHGTPDSPFPRVSKGLSGVMQYFDAMKEIVLHKFDIKNMLHSENVFSVLIDVKRTINKTGDTKEGQYVHVIKFQNGKLKEMDLYESNA